MSPYRVSVVVPTMRGWPILGISLDGILPQLDEVRGQLIVADASGTVPPADLLARDDVVWLSMPGASVFELRQAAYQRAEADVVAVTEDHCRPAPDWLESVIAAHEAAPDSALIFGAVENGTQRHLIDWALYCAGYAPQAPPLMEGMAINPGHANTSWKRWAFDRVPPTGELVLEFLFNAALRHGGHGALADDGLRVVHHQCDPVGPTAALFFHNGRAIAGIRRPHMGPRDVVRIVAPQVVAAFRTARTLRLSWAKPFRASAVRAAPLIGLLHMSHALGESIGYLAGAGDSGRHLH
jgi:hypothetical protein